jgi:hypothetical protein
LIFRLPIAHYCPVAAFLDNSLMHVECMQSQGEPMSSEGEETTSQVDSDSGNGASTASSEGQARRRRSARRPFPALTFEEALVLGIAIQKYAAGNKVRRLTLFDKMGRSAEGGTTRNLITASNQYGITSGSYTAEHLQLTADGSLATADDVPARDKVAAQFRLAIEGNEWFKLLYSKFKDNRLPDKSVLADALRDGNLETEYVQECVETFMVNASFLGLLKTVAGAERLLTLDFLLEEMGRQKAESSEFNPPVAYVPSTESVLVTSRTPAVSANVSDAGGNPKFDGECFYITPIGEEGSEQRKHSDLFMGSLVEPALQELGLRLVRADQIGQPGLITAQVIEHIVRSPLVVADLSYHNPNVFYELALRHAVRRPIVQIIRSADRVPFDLQPFRTVIIDNSSIYTLVPKLGTYRAEISAQIRMALESPDGDNSDNPLTAFYPGFWNAMPIAKP